jgi:hypothetical protein
MRGNQNLLNFIRRHGVPTRTWEDRPFVSRRQFFNLTGAGVLGSFISPRAQAQSAVRIDSLNVQTINRAKNTIFVLLTGAPSHTDTFDFKMVSGVTPASFAPVTINGVVMPKGLLPKLTERLGDYAIVRSMRSWALVHSLAQTWAQIGRSPLAALGDIAPNIGSIVAVEKESERRPGQVFPTFLGLNSQTAAGSGYLAASYGPFRVVPATTGLRNTTNPDGQSRLNDRLALLEGLDGPLRRNSPIGKPLSDYGEFYDAARGLTYNPVVDSAFRYTTAESAAYGNSGFGNACLVAHKVLKADQGTRYIQISLGGWDHHNNIYDDNGLPALGRVLDNGVGQLIADLKASGLYDSTLLVIAGEFGRTVGRLSSAQGRDHYLQQFCVLGGAGIKGGRAIGATDATGSRTTSPGWSRDRDIRPEDIEATILSAMGINWTSIRYDDPFNRGFEYVPYAHEDIYGPVNELWA